MKYFFACFLIGIGFHSFSQALTSFSVPPHAPGQSWIVSADISSLNLSEEIDLELVNKATGKHSTMQRMGQKIFWKIDSKEAFQFLEYDLLKGSKNENPKTLDIKKEKGQLAIYINGTKILGYQMAMTGVPEGVNPAYDRSGYIHPLNTPSGKRLTRIQPKDHYHHYGIWSPWTHVEYNGDTLDFWNLNQKQGTVRFADLIYSVSGPVFSEYQVLQEHVVLKGGKNEVALRETQTVRLTPVDDHSYLADFAINYNCATEIPFKILEYRYAGFGWRTTEEWDNQNSLVLTSEGKSRKDADGSTARWCIVQGKLGSGKGGAVMLSHPQNFNHPEPLRIWPENQYGRGDMFANFAPTKTKDWTLEPGKNYTLRYRMLVFDGEMNAEKAEAAWQAFARPIEITVKN